MGSPVYHKRFCFCLILTFFTLVLFGNDTELKRAEDTLRILFNSLGDASMADSQLKFNDEIISVLEKTLKHPDSFDHPFDSLPFLGKISSADDLVRIFTWNIAVLPHSHNYYGFLQVRETKGGEIRLHFLNHVKSTREDFGNLVITPENWYGILYYQIHPVSHSGRTFYTLIGMDFNNIFTNIKLVDVLTFEEGSPFFGYPLFQFKDGIRHRVIFEYSSRVVMFLRYIPGSDLIVYDHLSPESPRFKGQYRYYGPDFSYDALRFENGKWKYLPDVDWNP
jgi:hypothetical protein